MVEGRRGTWSEARNGLGVGWLGEDAREWRKRRDSGLRERTGYAYKKRDQKKMMIK